jgi:hypothetical protein
MPSRLWVSSILTATSILFSCDVLAAEKPKETDPAAKADTTDRWPAAEVTVGGQFQEGESDGFGDILVPVMRLGPGLVFVNPRASRTDHSEEEYNLGLGYRFLLPQTPVILGANTYYDFRDTRADSYNQWGVGLEMLSRWVDARVNYYKPENKEAVADSATEQQIESSSSTSSTWADPYATGNDIYQPLYTRQTTRTTTTTLFYEQYERAMEGFDGEIGLRLPLPIRPEKFDSRVFGGYYWFDADYGDDVQGGKARLELRLFSSLFFDAAWFENKDLTGSDYYVGGRLRVPFDLVELAHGRNPFAEARSRVQGKERLFASRLTEMVMRDPHIRTEVSGFIERPDLRQVETQSQTHTQREDVPLLEDVTFVSIGDLDGDGTAESTFNSIQEGIDRSFGRRNVYVFDAGSPYEENLVLAPGVTLWGSGCPVPGFGGKAFGGNSYPTLDGHSHGPAVTMANGSTIRGFRITNTDEGGEPVIVNLPSLGDTDVSRVGILGNDVSDVYVGCNLIEGNRQGALFNRVGNFNMSFVNNIVQDNDQDGLWITAMSDTFNQTGSENMRQIALADSREFNVLIDNSQFSYNEWGMNVSAFGYDAAFLDVRNSQFHYNNSWGSDVLMVGNELSSMSFLNTRAVGNGGVGLNVLSVDAGETTVMMSGVTANENASLGVNVNVIESEIALACIDRSIAWDNGGFGFNVSLVGGTVALANLSGISARNNGDSGIYLSLEAEEAALGVIGWPRALADAIKAAGLPEYFLPPEWMPVLYSSGPVEVVNNEGIGIYSMIQADGLAGSAIFDVTATENVGGGIYSSVISDDGMALGLAGSSKYLMETLQWASGLADLLHLTFPSFESSSGLMKLNNNSGYGLSLNVFGDDTSLAGVLGAEANNNQAMGVGILAQSEEMALAFASRIIATNTFGNGLMMTVDGQDTAIGAILNTKATGNLGHGISLDVTSLNGTAIGLVASTDPLRTLGGLGEDFLGVPITAPGEPFGPVVASGNVGDGLRMNLYGLGSTYGVVLDTQANGNGQHGIDATIISDEGDALALMLSSDLLMELLPFGPISFAPLGGIVANDNGVDGLRLMLAGYEDATAILGGITASENDNDGLNVVAAGVQGEASAVAAAIQANNNGAQGLDMAVTAVEDESTLFMAGVTANGNGRQGMLLSSSSASNHAFAILSGLRAATNQGTGIAFDVIAGGDAAVCMTDLVSVENDGRGVNAYLSADGNASLWASGADALSEFFDHYEMPYSIALFTQLMFPLILEGPIVTRDNQTAGFRAQLFSDNGSTEFLLEEAQANNNGNAGLNIDLSSDHGEVTSVIAFSTASGNDGRGLDLSATAGGSGTSFVAVVSLTTRTNGNDGVRISADSQGDLDILGERLVSVGNDNEGVQINAQALITWDIDFGGGALDSEGQSSIFNNGGYDFRNDSLGTAMIRDNWWGLAPPAPGQFYGPVDYTPWLTSDPNP